MRHTSLAAMAAAAFGALEALQKRPGVFITIRADARLDDLEARATKLQTDMEAICQVADDAERDMTDEEIKKLAEMKAQQEKLDAQIVARKALEPKSAGRKTRETVPGQVKKPEDPKGGFASLGEFAVAVKTLAVSGGREVDQRILAAAPSTSGNEGAGADGGILVPTEFRTAIYQKVMGELNLADRTDKQITSSNNMVLPADEGTPWDNATGIRCFWENELAQLTQSKPALEPKAIRLNKLTALVPISEELLDDAPALNGWLSTRVPVKMRARINTAIVRGTGAGQPLGMLNSPSKITVAAVGGQGANTVIQANISAMWARLFSECRGDAVWLINQEIEPQLDVLAIPGTGSPVPLYMPQGGLSASPFATLKGRPVLPMQACSALGTEGDIILTSLAQYLTMTKGTDIKTDVSMHLFFDAAAMAFRFILRIAGQPWWAKPITPENGNATLGWCITLNSTRT
jgi:HK97 family phage major capsid protein